MNRLKECRVKDLCELDPGFCNWFAGLVDGEGSLQIKLYKERWWLELTIALRDDDKPMLDSIKREMGRGKCYISRNISPIQHNSKSRYMLRFHSATDTKFFVSFFGKYPLRSKKNQVFRIWAAARKEMDKPSKLRDQAYLKYLYEAIRKARKYEEISIEQYVGNGKQLSFSN